MDPSHDDHHAQRYATVSLVMQVKDKRRKEEPLEVTRGEIRIGKELTDFQFLLRDYFLTCYIVGVIILSTIQLLGIIFLRSYLKHRQRQRILRQMVEENEDLSEALELDESQLVPETNDWEDLPQSGETNDQMNSQQQGMSNDIMPQSSAPITPPLNHEDLSDQGERHQIPNED